MFAASAPVVGNLGFELGCTNAPASTFGLMAIADLPDLAGSDPLGLGFGLHVQVGAPLFAVQVYASDAGGQGRYPLPLPAAPGLAGVTLYAQSVWDWGVSSCSPTPIGWSSTHGLAVTVQP